MARTNCNNCGAPLVKGKCQYCKATWFEPGLNIGSGYISEASMTAHNLHASGGRDASGMLQMTKLKTVYSVKLEIIDLTAEDVKKIYEAIGSGFLSNINE